LDRRKPVVHSLHVMTLCFPVPCSGDADVVLRVIGAERVKASAGVTAAIGGTVHMTSGLFVRLLGVH
jgi:hypothetical protein